MNSFNNLVIEAKKKKKISFYSCSEKEIAAKRD